MFLEANLVSPLKNSLPSTIIFSTTLPSTSISPASFISTPGNFLRTSSNFLSDPFLKESALYIIVSPFMVTGILEIISIPSNILSSYIVKLLLKLVVFVFKNSLISLKPI